MGPTRPSRASLLVLGHLVVLVPFLVLLLEEAGLLGRLVIQYVVIVLLVATVPVVVLAFGLRNWTGIDPRVTVTTAVALAIVAAGVVFAPRDVPSSGLSGTETLVVVVRWALAVLGTVSLWTFPLAIGVVLTERYSFSLWSALLNPMTAAG